MSVKKNWPSGQAPYLTQDGRRILHHPPLPPYFQEQFFPDLKREPQGKAKPGWAMPGTHKRSK